MKLHIYEPKSASMIQFVDFWSERYRYKLENLYTDNIGKSLTGSRVIELFIWKNGTPLSDKKDISVRINYIDRLDELKEFTQDFEAGEFLNRFSKGGAIWRIFWLHCFRPDEFPIYDQHVHRAMIFIKSGKVEEIPSNDPKKVIEYINHYLPFYSTFAGLDKRKLDKALWSFGKFIKENNFPMIQ